MTTSGIIWWSKSAKAITVKAHAKMKEKRNFSVSPNFQKRNRAIIGTAPILLSKFMHVPYFPTIMLLYSFARPVERPVERLVRRVVFCASSINDKRALFTASSFGKASATSGLSITMFDDSRTRFAYLPRTKPSGKSDRLYSARKRRILCIHLKNAVCNY